MHYSATLLLCHAAGAALLLMSSGCQSDTTADFGSISTPTDMRLVVRDTPELTKDNSGKAVPLAKDELDAKTDGVIQIRSDAFEPMKEIPTTYAGWGEDVSPPLQWTGVPAETKSLLVLMEDPDAQTPKPFIHWILFNIPANLTALRTGVPATGQLRELNNALQGMNSRGTVGYLGPKPPEGDPAHHYHFQIFALDTKLDVPQGATKAQLLAAAKGHVIAKGEIVGTYRKLPPK